MSDGFTAGLSARHDAAAAVLACAFPVEGFSPVAIGSVSRSVPPAQPAQPAPRHFSPADPGSNPTAGWDLLDPQLGATHIDPLAAAHAAGYAEGLAAAAVQAASEGERDRALVAGLADRLSGAGRIDREATARRLRETVLALTRQLVGEIGISGDRLAQRIEAASELLADKAEAALLRVHPDDIALLDGKLAPTLFAAGDAAVERGGFVLESASTIVEDGPTLWLDELAAAIECVPLPGPVVGAPC